MCTVTFFFSVTKWLYGNVSIGNGHIRKRYKTVHFLGITCLLSSLFAASKTSKPLKRAVVVATYFFAATYFFSISPRKRCVCSSGFQL